MTRSECRWQAARLAEPSRDIAFMLSCYDVTSVSPTGACPKNPGEAPQEGAGT